MVALRFMVWSVFTFAALLILGSVVARAENRPTVAVESLQNLKLGKFSLAVSASEKAETCPNFLVDSVGGRQEWPFVGQASADRRNTDCSLSLARQGLLAGNPGVKWNTFKPKYSGQFFEAALSRLDAEQLSCVKLQRDELRSALRDMRTLAVLSQEFEIGKVEIHLEALRTGPSGESMVTEGSSPGQSAKMQRLVGGKRHLVLRPVLRDGRCFAVHDSDITAAVDAEFRPIREAREKIANEKAAREREARRKAEEHDAAMNRAGQEREKINDILGDLGDSRVESGLEIKISDWWKRLGGESSPAPAAGSAQ